MRLDGHTALITGGTQGIGAAIAVRLAEAGTNVVLHGLRDDDYCRATVAACSRLGAEVACVFVDFAQPPETVVAQVLEQLGPQASAVDLLVNNAGCYSEESFLKMPAATLEATMRINVFAGFFLTQAFARQWTEQGVSGRVLFTGSVNGALAEAGHTAYDTSKGAVHAMVRSLCVALAPHGIRVNAMAPGLISTPLTASVTDEDADARRWMQWHTPNGQVPGASSCAGAALFLLSDEASHVHGQTLFVDGGMSAWQQPDLPEQLRGHLNASQESDKEPT